MKIINGTELSAKIRQTIKQEVEEIKTQGKRPPLLSVILVGDNPASQSYVRGKEKACLSVGMENRTIRLDAGISKWSAKAESLSRSGQLMPRSQREIASGDADITAASSS